MSTSTAPLPSEKGTFTPDKRTLGQLLASTSPALRVPDYQRDFSWDKTEIADFWDDIFQYATGDTQYEGEYFLGAIVLVNNGSYHLVLDGQQRLATATILLAAIRDKTVEYNKDASKQIQDQSILLVDAFTGATIPRLELNIFDREFFKQYIQVYPRLANHPAPSIQSHRLIDQAYRYFSAKLNEIWESAGGGKGGFDRITTILIALRDRVALISAIADTERSAAAIFTSLNDRGIGLSSVDLVRSHVLQNAHESQRLSILNSWESVFQSCGKDIDAEALMRLSWVAEHGDLKTRALYKVITNDLRTRDVAQSYSNYSDHLMEDAAQYRKVRDGDTDDPDLEEYWKSLRELKFNAGYAVFLAAARTFDLDAQRKLGKALRSLILRHNVICNLDRALLESTAFACAKLISDGGTVDQAISHLSARSPSAAVFTEKFKELKFSKNSHGIARYLLSLLDAALGATAEVTVAGAHRVHVEHIYPQTPKADESWKEHDIYLTRLGNLTLLDRRLNEKIKNGVFSIKLPFYKESRLLVTKSLDAYTEWNPGKVEERQTAFCVLAANLWPEDLGQDSNI